jgi:hypothetical protein
MIEMSSAYCAAPETLAGPSGRGGLSPIPLFAIASAVWNKEVRGARVDFPLLPEPVQPVSIISMDSGCFIFTVVLLVFAAIVVAATVHSGRVAAERSRRDLEERTTALVPYQEAWAKAQVAGEKASADIVLKCGDYVVRAAQQWRPDFVSSYAWEVYRATLPLLRKRPDLAPQVLAIGRIAYSADRPGGVPTVYDEEAIRNDILAHKGG